jgi:hypothetical protein
MRRPLPERIEAQVKAIKREALREAFKWACRRALGQTYTPPLFGPQAPIFQSEA